MHGSPFNLHIIYVLQVTQGWADYDRSKEVHLHSPFRKAAAIVSGKHTLAVATLLLEAVYR